MNRQCHLTVFLLSLFQKIDVSSLAPIPKKLFWQSAVVDQLRHRSTSAMSAASHDATTLLGGDGQAGSLIVSNMYKIGLLSDPSSRLRLLLASQSPRRREILDMMGLSGRYTAEPSPLNEEELQNELSKMAISSPDYAQTLAERKAHAMAVTMHDSLPNNSEKVTLIIGSDTIVDLDGTIMEKPKNEADAVDMIRNLSGNWHQVHTGVAVYAVGGGERDQGRLMFSFTDTANVKFATLRDEDIYSYVASKEPMDKAGGYGIQGIGGQLVERMEGDFFTVMGLPMHRLSRELSDAIRSLNI